MRGPFPVLAGCVAVILLVACAPEARASTPELGVVDSSCAPDRIPALRAAGVVSAVVEAHWDRFAPGPGVVDQGYAAALRARVQACLDGGLRVVLGSGVQYPPGWVSALPGTLLRDQRGSTHGLDVVWSGAVRAATVGYLRALLAALPADRLAGVRLGTSAAGELGLPGPADAGDGTTDSWWAFGDAPQRGTGLAAGAQVTPLPGWVPGNPTRHGRAVTPSDAAAWFRWYAGAVVEAVAAQADALRAAGFRGPVHVPAPGRGVLPGTLGPLLAGAPDAAHRGLSYPDQFAALARVGGVVLDLTSVDDASSVAARATGADVCQDTDAATADPALAAPVQALHRVGGAGSGAPAAPVQALQSGASTPGPAPGNPTSESPTSGSPTPGSPNPGDVAGWSQLRYARAQAARAGLPVVGENPGPPAPQTGGTGASDTEAQQLRRGPGEAAACGLALFQAAFEDDLFTGRSGASLADLTGR